MVLRLPNIRGRNRRKDGKDPKAGSKSGKHCVRLTHTSTKLVSPGFGQKVKGSLLHLHHATGQEGMAPDPETGRALDVAVETETSPSVSFLSHWFFSSGKAGTHAGREAEWPSRSWWLLYLTEAPDMTLESAEVTSPWTLSKDVCCVTVEPSHCSRKWRFLDHLS